MLIIIFFIISVLVSIILCLQERNRKDKISCFLTCLLAGMFLSLLVVTLTIEAFEGYRSETIEYGKENEIKGLQYQIESEQYGKGTFILGCGGYESGVKTEHTYSFFTVYEFGAKLTYVDDSEYEVYINETDDVFPNVKTIYSIKKFDGIMKMLFGERETRDEVGKVLTVPTNTIQIDFKVNVGG